MQTVFNNNMVAHVWAQRKQDSGRSHNGQFYFEGDTIYSYGKHFPIASFLGHNTVLYCDDTYSVTTSKHQSLVRSSIPSYISVIHCPDNEIMDYHKSLSPDNSEDVRKGAQIIIERCYNEAIQPLIKSAAKRKKASLIDKDLNKVLSLISNCKDLLRFYGLQLGKDLNSIKQSINHSRDALLETKKDEIEQERALIKQRKAKRAEREREDREKAASDFKAGVHFNHYYAKQMPVMLRVKGDKIETSHGAEFPINDAKKAFTLIRTVKEKSKTDITYRQSPSHMFKLGHFKIDIIEPNGNVKAGCHYVEWDEIERVARELKIYP